jgi:hypothetical protein
MNTSRHTTTSLDEKINNLEGKVAEKSFAYEMLLEQKKTIKRLFTTIFFLIAFIFALICTFLGTAVYFYNNYEIVDSTTSSYEYTQDGTGSNIIGNGNEVNG